MNNLAEVGDADRGRVIAAGQGDAAKALATALDLYGRLLPRMVNAETDSYAFTVRGTRVDGEWAVTPFGRSLRYDAIVTLGATRAYPDAAVLPGNCTARDYCTRLVASAGRPSINAGDLALVVWAAALTGLAEAEGLARTLFARSRTQEQLSTVEAAWTVLALAAIGDQSSAQLMADRLLAAQRASGMFPHLLNSSRGRRWRAHVACFADQVYPIQALSALHRAFGASRELEAADTAARRICALQGAAGQWWWHYDARDGSVIEKYPVYSVHQLSMAPMALLELCEAGGSDLLDHVRRGLLWQAAPTEPGGPQLLDRDAGVVWRSVRRREPLTKLTRGVHAATTSLRPGLRMTVLDRAFTASEIDRECRPYEAGWAFFAWETGRIEPAPETPPIPRALTA